MLYRTAWESRLVGEGYLRFAGMHGFVIELGRKLRRRCVHGKVLPNDYCFACNINIKMDKILTVILS